MVRAAIAAEEEYKDTLLPYAGAPAPVHSSMIVEPSSIGHVPSKPVCDGPLIVHPLVLHVEPATLQASTLMTSTRDASVDRSPPAANLLQPVKDWSGRKCSRGPSARLISLPSQSSHILEPSHSRPLAANRTCVPPVSAHVGYITVQGTERTSLRKQIADANGDSPGKRGYWKVVGGPGRRPHTYPPHPGHPLAPEGLTRSRMQRTRSRTPRTRSHRDTLAHQNARTD